MPAFAYLFFGICLAYVLAAIAGAWRLKHLGYQRFLPLGPIVLAILPWVFSWLRLPDIARVMLSVLVPLLFIGLVYATLRITWSEKEPAARVLRVTTATMIGYTISILLGGVI